ncbi:RNA ligase [Actinomadura sp. NBRC 104412]|uniref:RNA ligase (ATP) n=1 Tax=Actinomadura sp. NBRC 104412 TaxID=3032203 RepID=UPI0024A2630A|nr:RNA ligase (ATP) [Actinomadura sp. NBRC 104412]GLZ08726.1 RNA ligase [Actinomadura sp. NBRC 104412]
MSTLRVTAERLTIHPHDNADALELAQVGLYRAVVAKGQFRTGDWALYIPEGSVLPDDLIAELGLVGKLAGSEKNRVKAVRLRGELSQGIVCLPKAVDGIDLAEANAQGRDFAAELGVTKWVPPVPVHMAGEVVPAPDLLPWIEIEDIKRYPAMFEPGEPVVATEKIHGSACLFSLIGDETFVSSKGFGAKRLALAHDPKNLYWRAVESYGVPDAARRVADLLGADRVGVFGEVFGRGVQDLAYGANATGDRVGYAVFDIAVAGPDGAVRWLNPDELADVLAKVDLPAVPRLYEGPYTERILIELASGRETVSGTSAHLREGLVVRPAKERYSPITGGRAIAKFISPAYLTRKGGTEYE